MRLSAVALTLLIALPGCDPKQASPASGSPSSQKAAVDATARHEIATAADTEPVDDKEPPHFDSADARKTLRWIVNLTGLFRVPNPNAPNVKEQAKAMKTGLADCLQKPVKWKVPVESKTGDGKLVLSPIITTNFPDRSAEHPKISLLVRPWNYKGNDSLFACPAYPWLSSVQAGRDSVIVEGVISEIVYSGAYDWYVSLLDIRFSPESDSGTSLKTNAATKQGFDAENGEKTFAFWQREISLATQPFGDSIDRKRHKDEIATKLRSYSGSSVHWIWPAAVAPGEYLSLNEPIVLDPEFQMNVATVVLLKQPKLTGKSARSRLVAEYEHGYFGPAGSKGVDPAVLAKVGEAKKALVKGKIAKVFYVDDSPLLPRGRRIVVHLDDVVVEPCP
jgi:hypothetical protein